jgi:hypothetical protein
MKNTKYVIMLFILALKLNAQEIGIAPTKIWTNNFEIENPVGVSIYYLHHAGRLALKLEYVSANNERSYFGLLNGGFLIRPEDYLQDNIVSKSTFRAIEISCQIPAVFEILQNNISLGAGISFDKLTRNKAGLSTGKEYNYTEDKHGFFYLISLSRHNILGLPIKLEVLFKHKGLSEGNYATDSDQPFVSAIDVKELQLNFAYTF